MGVSPSFKEYVSVIAPNTGTTVVRSEVRKEVLEAMSVSAVSRFDQRPVISLLSTIATHHDAMVISHTNASDFGVIKISACTTDVGTGVNTRLSSVELEGRNKSVGCHELN
jgi:hypothetical protein